jgi:hypothetical protein
MGGRSGSTLQQSVIFQVIAQHLHQHKYSVGLLLLIVIDPKSSQIGAVSALLVKEKIIIDTEVALFNY